MPYLKQHHENQKRKEDAEGPQQFNIGDDQTADPTEGFESVEGENDDEKHKIKENRKKMKQEFKAKVDQKVTKKKESYIGMFVFCHCFGIFANGDVNLSYSQHSQRHNSKRIRDW